MWKHSSSRAVLFLCLVAAVASARGREGAHVRTLLLSQHPDDATHRLHVKGQVVTVLRFEQPCDPARTRLLGWEGRFEPVGVVGRWVLLQPLRDLAEDEAVPLLVTLADGTEVPFLLRPVMEGWPDQQVNVFKDRESHGAMASALREALEEKQVLAEQLERYRKEESSEDHALAALLASGAVKQTPFKVAYRLADRDAESDVEAIFYRGRGKAAVVLKVRHLHSEQAWSMKKVRLMTESTGMDRSVAFRSTDSSLAPGESGVVAIVADRSAFVEEGKLTNLVLEVYRHDGVRQAVIPLAHQLSGK
ncbi:DUF2381 family protein [Pyxidicoccus fallax]|uniref:DUF2381 family protein n=1 Tax=Pyxidicoccus fallax TaxID=394095 RepID=A0A848LV63_9BACT|nr:DUF2381 family protein [Pyxidicoccus fallax]NMO21224.1 DUF2381 family protein [Pyxidicoccus fallax]NPC82336.1 DUF2381 family protein [Pyxidicoccus fallax]